MASSTLEELREETLEWLDNPAGDKYAESPGANRFKRLDLLINRAYKHLVGQVDHTNQVWNRCAEPVVITVTSSAREYVIKPSLAQPNQFSEVVLVRKVLDITRSGVAGSAVREIPLVIIAWTKRDQYARRQVYPYIGAAESYGWSDELYIYRFGTLDPDSPAESSRGHWVVGFVDPEPASQTLKVYYTPEVMPLANSGDIPIQVPQQWQGLIAMKAASYALTQTDRKNRVPLLQDYSMELQLMKEDLSGLTSTAKAMPI